MNKTNPTLYTPTSPLGLDLEHGPLVLLAERQPRQKAPPRSHGPPLGLDLDDGRLVRPDILQPLVVLFALDVT